MSLEGATLSKKVGTDQISRAAKISGDEPSVVWPRRGFFGTRKWMLPLKLTASMPYVQFLGWRKKMTTWSWGLDCHRGLELWWCQILYVYLFLLMVLVGFLPKHLRCEKSPQLVSCWKCHQPVSGAICAKLVTTDCKNGIRLVSGLTYQNFLPNYNLHWGTRGQTIEVYTEKNVRISIIGFIGCLYMPYLPDMYMFCLWIFFR